MSRSFTAEQRAAMERAEAYLAAVGGDGSRPGSEPSPEDDRLEVVVLQDVATRPVEWLWKDRLARGYVALLVGDPGAGKSFVSCAITAATTRGWALPGDIAREPADVLILSAEDGAGDTIRPRLEAMGANLSRIRVVTGVRRGGKGDGYFSLSDDLELLEHELRLNPAAMAILDPIDAYMSGVDSHRAASVRGVLGPLAGIAERTGAAMLCIQHLTKGGADRAIYRPQGSIAYIAAARTALLVAANPDDADGPVRHMAALKNSYGPLAEGLRFTLAGGTFAWLAGGSAMSADQLLAAPDAGDADSPLAEAESVLGQALSDGPLEAKRARQVVMAAAGCSSRTVDRAKARLGVVSAKEGLSGWVWSLPLKDANPSDPEEGPETRFDLTGAKDASSTPGAQTWRPLKDANPPAEGRQPRRELEVKDAKVGGGVEVKDASRRPSPAPARERLLAPPAIPQPVQDQPLPPSVSALRAVPGRWVRSEPWSLPPEAFMGDEEALGYES